MALDGGIKTELVSSVEKPRISRRHMLKQGLLLLAAAALPPSFVVYAASKMDPVGRIEQVSPPVQVPKPVEADKPDNQSPAPYTVNGNFITIKPVVLFDDIVVREYGTANTLTTEEQHPDGTFAGTQVEISPGSQANITTQPDGKIIIDVIPK